jgi:hypothetical protein
MLPIVVARVNVRNDVTTMKMISLTRAAEVFTTAPPPFHVPSGPKSR